MCQQNWCDGKTASYVLPVGWQKCHPTYLSQRIGGSVDGFGFKAPHEQVGYNRTNEQIYGCAIDLSIISTWKRKYVFLKLNSSNVVTFWMDMEVLQCNCESWCNFCSIMEREESTFIDLKKASTWYGEMHHSLCSILINVICSTKCWVFLMWWESNLPVIWGCLQLLAYTISYYTPAGYNGCKGAALFMYFAELKNLEGTAPTR